MASDDGGSTIITVKKQPRYTNPDYREKMALCAQDLQSLRLLSNNIDDEDDFCDHMIAIIAVMSFLKMKEERKMQEDDMSLDSLSLSDKSTGSIFEFDISNMDNDSNSTSSASSISPTTLSSLNSMSSTSRSTSTSSESFTPFLHLPTNARMIIGSIGELNCYAEIVCASVLVLSHKVSGTQYS